MTAGLDATGLAAGFSSALAAAAAESFEDASQSLPSSLPFAALPLGLTGNWSKAPSYNCCIF